MSQPHTDFITALRTLAKTRNYVLNRAWKFDYGQNPSSMGNFYTLLPRDIQDSYDEKMYYLIFCVYMKTHDFPSYQGNFGASLRQLVTQMPIQTGTKIFTHLLNVSFISRDDHDAYQTLTQCLRRCFNLMRKYYVRVNYTQLLKDLLAWIDPNQKVQLAWARQFYRGVPTVQ